MKRHAVGLIAFTAALIAGFALLGAYFHELSGAASYDVTAWRGAAQGPAQEVSPEAGRAVFAGRGGCIACHIFGDVGVGIRGPNLGVEPPHFTEPIGVRAAHMEPGTTAVEHVVRSLYEPDSFITPGFESGVMVPVHGPPSMLTHDQVRSLILFMFDRSGVPITPELEEEIAAAQRPYSGEEPGEDTSPAQAAAPALPTADAEAGRARMEELGCEGCHGEEAAPLGELTSGDDVALALRIGAHPHEDDAPAYGDTLTLAALADIVAALRAAEQPGPEEPPAEEQPAEGPPAEPPAQEPPAQEPPAEDPPSTPEEAP